MGPEYSPNQKLISLFSKCPIMLLVETSVVNWGPVRRRLLIEKPWILVVWWGGGDRPIPSPSDPPLIPSIRLSLWHMDTDGCITAALRLTQYKHLWICGQNNVTLQILVYCTALYCSCTWFRQYIREQINSLDELIKALGLLIYKALHMQCMIIDTKSTAQIIRHKNFPNDG